MNTFLSIGILLFLAIYSGRIFHKIKLPMVTGYILIGFIIGNSAAFHLLSPYFAKIAIYIDQFALSVISLEMGMEFSLKRLRKIEKKIFIITIIQAVFTWFIIFTGLKFLTHIPSAVAMVVASIGVATAPDIIILVTREYNIKGLLSEYLKGIVTLDDLFTELAFFIILPIAQSLIQFQHLQNGFALIIIKEIVLSVVLGVGLGILFSFIANSFRKLRTLFAITLGFIFITIGLSVLLKLHVILVSLLVGAVFTNFSREKRTIHEVLSQIDAPLFITFLIVNGSTLSFKLLFESGILGLSFILTRSIGKITGGFIGGFIAKIKKDLKNNIGWALLPQSELSIYLAILAKSILPHYGNTVFAAIMMGVVFFEIVGAPLLKNILTREERFKKI